MFLGRFLLHILSLCSYGCRRQRTISMSLWRTYLTLVSRSTAKESVSPKHQSICFPSFSLVRFTSTLLLFAATYDIQERVTIMEYQTFSDECVHITNARFLPGQEPRPYPVSNPDNDAENPLLEQVWHAQKHRIHLTVMQEDERCFLPRLELEGYKVPCEEKRQN